MKTPKQAKPGKTPKPPARSQATKARSVQSSVEKSGTSKKSDKPKRPTGKPSKFTQQLADEICQRMSLGEPLAQICRDHHMPDPATVWRWQQTRADLSQAIARARIIGFDVIADECLAIVDNELEDPASRRVRTDVRLKLLAKWDPKRYGERIEQAIEIETGPKTLESIEERARRVAAVLSIAHD